MHSQLCYLIYLYACGAASVSAQPPKQAISWQALWSLAHRQAITGVIAHALRRSEALDCPAELRTEALACLYGDGLRNAQRQAAVLKIIALMERAGLHPVVLKGMDLARFYAHPECRSSADTDLLLPQCEEQAALRLLGDEGFAVARRGEKIHHSSCFRPDTGLLELHVMLWSSAAEQGVFAERSARLLPLGAARRVTFGGAEISVLPETDALLFLAMHLVKHFAVQGVGVRMAYDFTLYYAKNHTRIDLERFWSAMEQLGFSGIINGILGIFVYWGGFDERSLAKMQLPDESLCRMLLADFTNYSTKEEADTSLINETWVAFCKRTAKRAGCGLRVRMAALRAQARLRLLFPSVQTLALHYPYLHKRGWLYPAAWVQRSFAVLRSRQRRGAVRALHDPHPGAARADERQRTELFQALGL